VGGGGVRLRREGGVKVFVLASKWEISQGANKCNGKFVVGAKMHKIIDIIG
jgi:hypothetical protein